MSVEFAPDEEGSTELAPIPLFGRLLVPALPAPTTPLVGRVDAVNQLVDLLVNPDVRLVTLIGPGGIGKTRLAIEAARRVASPVAFVSLAATVDPALIVPTIARAAGLEPVRDVPPELALRQALHERSLLLVIDNFEQLLHGAVVIGDLLRNCPGLRVLVTSRVRLSLSGEHVVASSRWPCPSLARRWT